MGARELVSDHVGNTTKTPNRAPNEDHNCHNYVMIPCKEELITKTKIGNYKMLKNRPYAFVKRHQDWKNVVYLLECEQCPWKYVGCTTKTLKKRCSGTKNPHLHNQTGHILRGRVVYKFDENEQNIEIRFAKEAEYMHHYKTLYDDKENEYGGNIRLTKLQQKVVKNQTSEQSCCIEEEETVTRPEAVEEKEEEEEEEEEEATLDVMVIEEHEAIAIEDLVIEIPMEVCIFIDLTSDDEGSAIEDNIDIIEVGGAAQSVQKCLTNLLINYYFGT